MSSINNNSSNPILPPNQREGAEVNGALGRHRISSEGSKDTQRVRSQIQGIVKGTISQTANMNHGQTTSRNQTSDHDYVDVTDASEDIYEEAFVASDYDREPRDDDQDILSEDEYDNVSFAHALEDDSSGGYIDNRFSGNHGNNSFSTGDRLSISDSSTLRRLPQNNRDHASNQEPIYVTPSHTTLFDNGVKRADSLEAKKILSNIDKALSKGSSSKYNKNSSRLSLELNRQVLIANRQELLSKVGMTPDRKKLQDAKDALRSMAFSGDSYQLRALSSFAVGGLHILNRKSSPLYIIQANRSLADSSAGAAVWKERFINTADSMDKMSRADCIDILLEATSLALKATENKIQEAKAGTREQILFFKDKKMRKHDRKMYTQAQELYSQYEIAMSKDVHASMGLVMNLARHL